VGSASQACSRKLVGYRSQAPRPDLGTMNRDTRKNLPVHNIFATLNPLEVGKDPRRPSSAPTLGKWITKRQQSNHRRYPDRPYTSMMVHANGTKEDPPAGLPGPRGLSQVSRYSQMGPSTPENLKIVNSRSRCHQPLSAPFAQPSSATPSEALQPHLPGVPHTMVCSSYTGYQPGNATAAGISKAAVIASNKTWQTVIVYVSI